MLLSIDIATSQADNLQLLLLGIGAMFVGVSAPLTLHGILMHLLHYVNPRLQRYYIRVLWLVPIFGCGHACGRCKLLPKWLQYGSAPRASCFSALQTR